MLLPGNMNGSSLISVGSNIGRQKIELAAEEQDAAAEVLEAAESPGIGLDGLNDRVEAFGGGIGDAVLGVVQQAVAVTPQHPHDLLERLDAASHGPGAPGVEVGRSRFHVAVLPEGREAFLERPRPAGLQIGLVQMAKCHRLGAALVGQRFEPVVFGFSDEHRVPRLDSESG